MPSGSIKLDAETVRLIGQELKKMRLEEHDTESSVKVDKETIKLIHVELKKLESEDLDKGAPKKKVLNTRKGGKKD